jgi:hypothetical protein
MQRSRNLRGELLDDLEVDVGLEQGEPDLAHGAIDVCLAQLAARANAGQRVLKAIGEWSNIREVSSLRASRARVLDERPRGQRETAVPPPQKGH